MAPALPSPAALTRSLADVKLPILPAAAAPPAGTPTEIYIRIARGAVACWFSPNGLLKGHFVYHAEAAPASKGGHAGIVIRTPETPGAPGGQNWQGQRVYRIDIVAAGATAVVETENFRLPDPLAAVMTRDVQRWAAAGYGCDDKGIAAGWTPRDPGAPSAPVPVKSRRAAAQH